MGATWDDSNHPVMGDKAIIVGKGRFNGEAVMRLERELEEANSEIARHHRDFERIRNLLDHAEADQMTRQAALKGIRSIVG